MSLRSISNVHGSWLIRLPLRPDGAPIFPLTRKLRNHAPVTCLRFFQKLSLRVALVIILPYITGVSGNASAETPITPSGLNTHISSPVSVGGKTQYDITGGTRTGANLFHSFGNFDVPGNTITNFRNDSLLQTDNILGRVTGNHISDIFGTIKTTDFGNAHLFLMNPAGFLFGPNASLNVSGAVTFTSADYLKFEDGRRFSAAPNPVTDVLLTASPVASFGFLGSHPGAITVQGSQLEVRDGTGISLVGGNITIESTVENGAVHPAQLRAPNGNIQLASTASPGEFDITLESLPNVDQASFTSFGSVSLTPNSTVNVSGTNIVSIRGGQFVLSIADAVLSTANSTGELNSISLSPDSSISSTAGVKPGNDIHIEASSVNLNGARITTLSDGPANAGNIVIKAIQQLTAADSVLGADALGETGNGGNISLKAPTIQIKGGVFSTTTVGIGDAGNVLLEGRQIQLLASPVEAAQGVDLFTITTGSGHGGAVTVHGLNGPSSYADEVTISGTSRLHTEAFSDGSPGDISIDAVRFTLTDNATMNADTNGSKAAGRITITATDHATISGPSTTMSSSTDFEGAGNAGTITVTAPNITIENGGRIFTDTSGNGTGGNIDIVATQSVTLGNKANVSANSTGTGNAGNVHINAGQSFLASNSSVTTQARDSSGGTIKVETTPNGTVHLTNSIISASVSDGPGGGGNVSIDPQIVILQNSKILAKADDGRGGRISIVAGLFLPDANSTINADSGSGVNGTVTIQSPTSNLSSTVGQLVSKTSPSQVLLHSRCAALADGEHSTFILAGRKTLPSEPGGWLLSPIDIAIPRLRTSTLTKTGSPLRTIPSTEKSQLLSLRQIVPPGFLTHMFAVESNSGCAS